MKVHEGGEKLDVIELNIVNTNDEAKSTVEELHEVRSLTSWYFLLAHEP